MLMVFVNQRLSVEVSVTGIQGSSLAIPIKQREDPVVRVLGQQEPCEPH